MPRTNIPVVTSDTDGELISYAAADQANGMEFVNTGIERLRVKNADASAEEVTVDSPALCNQGGTHDIVKSVPAGEEHTFGPFPTNRFNQTGNLVYVDFDADTSTTVAVAK